MKRDLFAMPSSVFGKPIKYSLTGIVEKKCTRYHYAGAGNNKIGKTTNCTQYFAVGRSEATAAGRDISREHNQRYYH